MESFKIASIVLAASVFSAVLFQPAKAQTCATEVDNASYGRRYETYFWRVGSTGSIHMFAKHVNHLGGQEVDYGPIQQAYERWSRESASDSRFCRAEDYHNSQLVHGCGESSIKNLAKAMECNFRSGGRGRQASTPISANSTIGGRPPSATSAGIDEVTPQVPGCPRYYSKLNIEWRRKPGANPQLNVWEVQNVSDRFTFRVTYRTDGANTDLPTLNPGDTAEAWGLRSEPPFVVRNFYDMKVWERSISQEKSLQCSLAIRPQ